MSKKLDLTKSVYELCKEYPELVSVMSDLGFTEITKKVTLTTVGRIMTIPKGVKAKNLDLETVLSALKKHGYDLIGIEQPTACSHHAKPAFALKPFSEIQSKMGDSERSKLLESYVKRLSDGEPLDSVRKDFVANFKDVDASEIAMAEQALISSGTPFEDVQRLCDVHSALFHGAINTEKKAVEHKTTDLSFENVLPSAQENEANQKYQELCATNGHPLQLLTLENQYIKELITNTRNALELQGNILESLKKAREVAKHYSKKGDLLYPLLKVKYGISGPADVMWSVDDEIRAELRSLAKKIALDQSMLQSDEWKKRMEAVLTRMEEMIYKENNILFPICASNFDTQEWNNIARDMQEYDFCLDVIPKLSFEESESAQPDAGEDGQIIFPTGKMTPSQLAAMLDAIPMEITFIDDKDINQYFNDGNERKLFKRPRMSLYREVYSCHPPKVELMVRKIIQQFKSGNRDSFDLWHTIAGEPIWVRYMAVRDKKGKYIGAMECVQKLGFAQEHFKKVFTKNN